MAEEFIFIKKVDLNNHCPTCYSNEGLQLSFSQKTVETNFYKAITPEIKYELACKTCNNTIYPVSWTEDIERVVAYQNKAFNPLKTSRHLKKASWLAIIVLAIIAICAMAILVYSQL